MRIIIFSLMCLLAYGCTTGPTSSYRQIRTELSFPPADLQVTVSVGEDMLTSGYFMEWDGIELLDPVKVSMVGGYKFDPGEYRKIGSNQSGSFYQPTRGERSGRVSTIPVSNMFPMDDLFRYIFIKNDGQFCAVAGANQYFCKRDANYIEKKVGDVGLNSFQRSLIYSGRVGNKLRLTYHEVSNGGQDASFVNYAEYDLSQSSEISYMGAILEVINANNDYIEFIVKEPFAS